MKGDVSMADSREIVLVMSVTGNFVGELKSEDPFVITKPLQLLTVEQEVEGRRVPMTVPVYLNMDEMTFVNNPLSYGIAPKELQEKYMEVRAQSSGITIPNDEPRVVELTKH